MAVPQISDGLTNDVVYNYREPDLTYRLGNDTVSGKITGIQSIQQAITHILSTERYASPIYSDNYGSELEQYIGKDIGYISADIEQTLSDALMQDDRITGVTVTSVSRGSQVGACLIKFSVNTIYGELSETLEVG